MGKKYNKYLHLKISATAIATTLAMTAPASAGVVGGMDILDNLDNVAVAACNHANHAPGLHNGFQKAAPKSLDLTPAITATVPASSASSVGVPADTGASSTGTQVVFLDFDTATTGTFTREYTDDNGDTQIRTYNEHIYTAAQREAIRAQMQNDYGQFDVEFTTEQPTGNGEHSTIFFNANMPGEGNGTAAGIRITPDGRFINGILWGIADHIDFRNMKRGDSANVDANFWSVLSTGGFESLTGMTDTPENRAIAVMRQSAQTGSHELGHNLGLRHYDAWGPIGTGLPDTGVPANDRFLPVYTGPRNAVETLNHLMVSGASGGSPIDGSISQDRYFSLRSATKLAFNEQGRVIQEVESPSFQVVDLVEMNVPDTLERGTNHGRIFQVAAISIEGRIESKDDLDGYIFEGREGDIFNFELMSFVSSTNLDYIDGNISIFDMAGNLLATLDDEFESMDPFLFDFILDFTGQFRVILNAWDWQHPFDTVNGDFAIGNYQLFVTRTRIDAPAALGLMLLGLAGVGLSRRRRQSVK